MSQSESMALYILMNVLIIMKMNDAQCTFDDAAGSGQVLDLTALAATIIYGNDNLTPPNDYQFSPCRNALSCGSEIAMASKRESIHSSDYCQVIAKWDSSILPTYSEQRWTFQYNTGQNCEGSNYNFTAIFDCDSGISDYKLISSGLYIFIFCIHICHYIAILRFYIYYI